MAEEQVKVQEVERSASRLESELRDQIGRMQSSTRTTLIVGCVLILIVLVYMTVLTHWIKKESDPVVLAETVESLATTEGLPVLKETAIAQAPEVARMLRQQVTDLIPMASGYVETQAMTLTDALVDKLDASADEMVGKFIADQQTELRPLIEKASEPGSAQELEAAFTASLEELVGQKMDELLTNYDRGMRFVDSRLTRFLNPNMTLTGEEQFQKECVVRLMSFINEASKQAVLEIGQPK